jgi:CRP-like cAMP-binding protein
MAPGKSVDKEVLKTLTPPASLNAQQFSQLSREAIVEEVPAGRVLFKEGEVDRTTIYLLSGEIELTCNAGRAARLRGGSEQATAPIANEQPRRATATAKTAITITRFDTDLLDVLLTWDQLSGIEVSDITPSDQTAEISGDWMTRILQSKAFLRIPPANIQTMFMRLQELSASAGQVVVKQGDEGDYYYIIGRGQCEVTRRSASGSQVTLARLGAGDCFGEEALLSLARRNATVTMQTDGRLMRLAKSDFEELLKSPMVKEVELEQAQGMVKTGAVLVDVRLEAERQGGGIKGSLHVPLYMLRLRAETFDPGKTYICFCTTGRRSSAAAFLLSERGFDSCMLKGGLRAIANRESQA